MRNSCSCRREILFAAAMLFAAALESLPEYSSSPVLLPIPRRRTGVDAPARFDLLPAAPARETTDWKDAFTSSTMARESVLRVRDCDTESPEPDPVRDSACTIEIGRAVGGPLEQRLAFCPSPPPSATPLLTNAGMVADAGAAGACADVLHLPQLRSDDEAGSVRSRSPHTKNLRAVALSRADRSAL